MRPELWTIPGLGLAIKSYGFMMMCGFLVAIWFAMRRAMRVKADPDMVLNIGFVSLFCGVGGARLFFVAHYWESSFAHTANPLWEAVKITSGGLEYYGGLIGAVVGVVLYLRFIAKFHGPGDDPQGRPSHRPSLRLYLDIVAPAAMLGLAVTRMGCFLNGCCWGGLCVGHDPVGPTADARAAERSPLDADQPDATAGALPWAVSFPFGSPAHIRQWENRQVAVPAELIFDNPKYINSPFLMAAASLSASVEDVEAPRNRYLEAAERHRVAKDSGDQQAVASAKSNLDAAGERLEEARMEHFSAYHAMRYPSPSDPSRGMTRTELAELAAQHGSLPVHPAQLYALANGALLSWLLTTVFYRRKRHGIVFGLMLLLYPISRPILESVRVDNPHDVAGLTISQAVSLGIFLTGVAWMYVVCTRLPLRSVRAVVHLPPTLPEKKDA